MINFFNSFTSALALFFFFFFFDFFLIDLKMGDTTRRSTVSCPTRAVASPTGSTGAVVNYIVNATDNSGILSLTCTKSTGSVFANGTTTVSCTAIDNMNLQTTCSFIVYVAAPPGNEF